MALFTDGPASSMEDLTGQDSQLLDVASTEGIDVTRKLELAQEEVTLELGALLATNIGDVVVTPALKLWHTFRTLELVYADAYQNQLNDRYAGKRDEFAKRVKWAYDMLIRTGIGIVTQPVPRAETPTLASAP